LKGASFILKRTKPFLQFGQALGIGTEDGLGSLGILSLLVGIWFVGTTIVPHGGIFINILGIIFSCLIAKTVIKYKQR
jgi:hypothetical protein